jgi:NAD-dependent DNA ligase
MSLDPHGQPINLAFNQAYRAQRDISEMLGLAKGLLADGQVSDSEALLIRDWMRKHPDAQEYWAVRAINERLERAFADGTIDEQERTDLAELLEELVGGRAGVIAGDDSSTQLPLDRPPPVVAWERSVFVLTGRFAFGPRRDCERQVLNRGGRCEASITRRTNYLVVGTFGSRDWVHTSFGRKIEKAVGYRDSGLPLAILCEDHWARCLQ